MDSPTPRAEGDTIPFPHLDQPTSYIAPLPGDQTSPPTSPTSPKSPRKSQASTPTTRTRKRTGTVSSVASVASSRLRSASIKLIDSDVPLGAWAGLGAATSHAPSLADIRRGSYASPEFELEKEKERRASIGSVEGSRERWKLSRTSSGFSSKSLGAVGGRGKRRSSVLVEEESGDPLAVTARERDAGMENEGKEEVEADVIKEKPRTEDTSALETAPTNEESPQTEYQFPPKLPWTTSFAIGLRAFWGWFLTPLGFLITIYALNVVAWGGMLFLLLCNASPAMCHPTCNDINSPRRKWIEWDSQILNALFCVTGYGLIPWRFRDLYWLLVYRIGLQGRSREKRMIGLRRLAGIHRGWFRLQGSQEWTSEFGDDRDATNDAVPLPLTKRLDPPLTGVRAPPTATWRLDFVIWCMVWNTFFQVCLCGFMWGLTRYVEEVCKTSSSLANISQIYSPILGYRLIHWSRMRRRRHWRHRDVS